MFYLGDADPFGAEIFFTYFFDSLTSCIVENKSQCQTMFNLEWIGPFIPGYYQNKQLSKNFLKLTHRDKSKAFTILSQPYLSDAYLGSDDSEGERQYKMQLTKYKEHLKSMVQFECKFEVEALLSP